MFWSRKLSEFKKRYEIYDKELCNSESTARMKILFYKKSIVYTDFIDHKNLRNFTTTKAESMTDLMNWVVSRLWISDLLQEE
jgi:hypothetical protein